MKFLIVAFLVVFGFSAQAVGACASPNGVTGQFQFIAGNGFHICQSTGTWLRITQVNTFVACTVPDGTFFFRSPLMIGCLSGMEHGFDGIILGACSAPEAGRFSYNSGTDGFKYCNGTNWIGD